MKLGKGMWCTTNRNNTYYEIEKESILEAYKKLIVINVIAKC